MLVASRFYSRLSLESFGGKDASFARNRTCLSIVEKKLLRKVRILERREERISVSFQPNLDRRNPAGSRIRLIFAAKSPSRRRNKLRTCLTKTSPGVAPEIKTNDDRAIRSQPEIAVGSTKRKMSHRNAEIDYEPFFFLLLAITISEV